MLNGYAPVAVVNGGFETFCVEASVTFSPGKSYSFTLSDTDSQGRALTEGAAFLYQQFATGALSPLYDYNNAANRKTDAGMLQSALWMLQGNQSGGSSFPNGGTGNIFYNYAVNFLGGANVLLANNGKYDVEVLQMWDAAGATHQNQLVLNPTPTQLPEGGMTLVLLAMGLAGLTLGKLALGKSSAKA